MLCCLFLVTLFTVLHRSTFVASRQKHLELPGLSFHRSPSSSDTQSMIFRMRRDGYSAHEESCKESSILQNVTLKGGLEAGYFRKLAQHVAMRLCVELCCEEKGCDVAFMWGKNCYGVQCFTHELCDVIPAAKKVASPILISHVTFHGQKASKQKKQPEPCTSTQVQTGVTLRGGLKSGNFTHIGTVMNLKTCINLCCMTNRCDIALVINDQCFAISCYTTKLCEMTKAFTKTYKPQLAYVQKPGMGQKQNLSTLNLGAGDPTENQLICKNSQLFVNTTLKGGYRAGNYTNFGKVRNMTECIRLCCGNRNCDAALMLENNCFSVACKDADNCLPVHAKSTQALAALNPRVSYITSRSEEVLFAKQETPEGICHAGIVSYDVSLRGGSTAGNFTPHGKVKSIQACISKCCVTNRCDVAVMLREICYTVVCKNERACEKRPTPTGSVFNPRIVYVFKDKKRKNEDFGPGRIEETRKRPKSQSRFQNLPLLPYQPTPSTSYSTKMVPYYQHKHLLSLKPLKYSQTSTNAGAINSMKDKTTNARYPLKHVLAKTTTATANVQLNEGSPVTNADIENSFLLNFLKNNTNAMSTIASRGDADYRKTVLTPETSTNRELGAFPQYDASWDVTPALKSNKTRSFSFKLKNNSGASLTTFEQHESVVQAAPSQKIAASSLEYTPTLSPNRLDDFVSTETEDEANDESSTSTPTLNSTKGSYLVYPDSYEQVISKNSTSSQDNLVQLCEDPESLNHKPFDSCSGSALTTTKVTTKILGQTSSSDNQEQSLTDRDNITTSKGEKTLENEKNINTNKSIEATQTSNVREQTPLLSRANKENNTDTNKTIEATVTSFLSRLAANHQIIDADYPTCKFSDVLHNTTLRGNLRSGKFTDRGHMENIKQCARLCCMLNKCDVAFMLFNTCFTVECIAAQLCDPVPAKSTIDSPTLIYILVKKVV